MLQHAGEYSTVFRFNESSSVSAPQMAGLTSTTVIGVVACANLLVSAAGCSPIFDRARMLEYCSARRQLVKHCIGIRFAAHCDDVVPTGRQTRNHMHIGCVECQGLRWHESAVDAMMFGFEP